MYSAFLTRVSSTSQQAIGILQAVGIHVGLVSKSATCLAATHQFRVCPLSIWLAGRETAFTFPNEANVNWLALDMESVFRHFLHDLPVLIGCTWPGQIVFRHLLYDQPILIGCTWQVLKAPEWNVAKMAVSATDEDFEISCSSMDDAELTIDVDPMMNTFEDYFFGLTADSHPACALPLVYAFALPSRTPFHLC